MKNLKYILLLIGFGIMATIGYAEKRSLIIAVGDYPEAGGWPDIASANDVPYVSKSLQQLGFKKANIRILKDQQATKKGILSAFELLLKQVRTGDYIYLHFSGHGQQVPDDNGDEVDQLDEAIVPYDSHLKYKAGINEGQFLIRDDELRGWLKQLRLKAGPKGQVIWVVDACHSGTGTRGLGAYRGSDIVLAPPSFYLNKKVGQVKEKSFEPLKENSPQLAPLASFFGASPNQLNFETVDFQGEAVGSLTYAMSQVLANMKRVYTFKEVYDRVALKMKVIAPRQSPVWEGEGNLQILGGSLQNQAIIHNVLKVVDPQTITADIGNLHNVFEGTTVEILAMNNKIQATGLVTRAGLSQSEIKIDGFLLQHKNIQYRVRIKQLANPPIYCLLASRIPPNSRWYALSREILKNNFIQLHNRNPELVLSTHQGDGAIQLATRTGEIIYNSKSGNIEKHQFELKGIIKRFTQAKYLKGYQLKSPNLNLSLEVLHIPCQTKDVRQVRPFPSNPPVVKLGNCIKLRITNRGRTTAYFSVLDIQPDHKINMLIPAIHLGYSASDYYLKPGESFTTEFNIRLVEPIGEEVLKLVSSSKPIDLPTIMETRGMSVQDKDKAHPFAQLMAHTFQQGGSRGNSPLQSTLDDISVATYFFRIVP